MIINLYYYQETNKLIIKRIGGFYLFEPTPPVAQYLLRVGGVLVERGEPPVLHVVEGVARPRAAAASPAVPELLLHHYLQDLLFQRFSKNQIEMV